MRSAAFLLLALLFGRTALGALSTVESASAAEQGAGQVQDLRYGVTLYHYYQQHYFDALTELMVAGQLHELPNHGAQAELLRGGMSLSYGMDRQAQSIFERLLGEARGEVDANKAWYYLAKSAWHRGDTSRANVALARMAPDYRGPVADGALYLKAMLELQRGDIGAAGGSIGRLDNPCPWLGYYHYNLGAARAVGSDWTGAVQSFRLSGQSPCDSEEDIALRDKSHTAAGYAQLAVGDYAGAASDFTRVRLHSPESERALLGYGWSAASAGDYLAALSPWNTLSERSPMGPSTRESLLAIPWAWEQLQRPGLALEQYLAAAERFDREALHLSQLSGELETGDMQELLGLDWGDTQEWLGAGDILPPGPFAPYLRQLLSADRAQLALREMRDLNHIASQLDGALERLQALEQVNADQQQVWEEVLEGNRRQQLAERRQLLLSAAEESRRTLEQAQERADGRILADAGQHARWLRLERASGLAEQLAMDDPRRERIRILRGLMLWEDSEQYPDRLWRLQREMQELESLLEQSQIALAGVDEAIVGQRTAPFSQRIGALRQRVTLQQQQVAMASELAQANMRRVALEELQSQELQLSRALGQARLAVARLYEQGSSEVPR